MKKIYIVSLFLLLCNTFVFSQISITLSGCGANTFFYYGIDSTGRNIYHDGSGQYSIEWYATTNEWVVVYLPGYSIGYSNSFTSLPDPPCYGTGTWAMVTPGCGDLTGMFGSCQSTLTAVDEYTKRWGLEVYPNPGSGLFQFKGVAENSDLEIFDMQGRQILHQHIEGKQTLVDIQDAEKGIYIYRIRDEEGISTEGKLILY